MEVFKTLSKKDRLWIPYHVCWEFFERRLTVIDTNKDQYNAITKALRNSLDQIRNVKNHPMIDLQSLAESIEKLITSVKEKEEVHPSYNGESEEILEDLMEIFENNVGNEPTKEKIKDIEKDGEDRFKKDIPPGFQDKKKTTNKYGDLIIWKEIIEKAKSEKKDIIFITDDGKKDWWLIHEGKKIMPLPQLRKEISDDTGMSFHMYTPEKFLDHIKDETINTEADEFNINPNIIEEVKKVGEINGRQILSNPQDIRMLINKTIENLLNNIRFFIGEGDLGTINLLYNNLTEIYDNFAGLDLYNKIETWLVDIIKYLEDLKPKVTTIDSIELIVPVIKELKSIQRKNNAQKENLTNLLEEIRVDELISMHDHYDA